MKIPILENLNAVETIRKCGYGLVADRNASEQSFARRLGSGFYPRFHAYLENGFINLHLDQKQASYGGYSKHSGEYDGDTVEREAERIKNIIDNFVNQPAEESVQEEEKKGFWGNLFGK